MWDAVPGLRWTRPRGTGTSLNVLTSPKPIRIPLLLKTSSLTSCPPATLPHPPVLPAPLLSSTPETGTIRRLDPPSSLLSGTDVIHLSFMGQKPSGSFHGGG